MCVSHYHAALSRLFGLVRFRTGTGRFEIHEYNIQLRLIESDKKSADGFGFIPVHHRKIQTGLNVACIQI